MNSVLDQLQSMTVVVADTGEVAAVKAYKPIDCCSSRWRRLWLVPMQAPS
jgi:transaldolase